MINPEIRIRIGDHFRLTFRPWRSLHSLSAFVSVLFLFCCSCADAFSNTTGESHYGPFTIDANGTGIMPLKSPESSPPQWGVRRD